DLRARVAALRPKPWPVDSSAAARALRDWKQPDTAVVYVADGLTGGADFSTFADALTSAGAVTEICCDTPPARLLLPPRSEPDRLVARIAQVPQPVSTEAVVLAQSGDGRTLARATATLPAGAATAEAPITLPTELRNRLGRLV